MTREELIVYLLERLHTVQQRYELAPAPDASVLFADTLDSMGLVEFIGQVAEDCAVEPEAIEQAVGCRFSTVAALATALHTAGLVPGTRRSAHMGASLPEPMPCPTAWLAAASVRLPVERQPADQIDALLARPAGWCAAHTGIEGRCLAGPMDMLAAAADAARACLEQAAMSAESITALLVTGEAPPLAVGLAAALHARIGLPAGCPALEVGGACTGLVVSLWLGQRLLQVGGAILVVAVETPSRWLTVQPGPAGETAALFGDGAGACLLTAAVRSGARRIRDVVLGGDGSAGHLLQALPRPTGVVLEMDGPALATRVVRVVAESVRDLVRRQHLELADLSAVVVHGGNGRLPGLLARRLGLPDERIWSETARTGNLGSVSLLAAWAARGNQDAGPVVWAAIGAGLLWGTVLLDGP